MKPRSKRKSKGKAPTKPASTEPLGQQAPAEPAPATELPPEQEKTVAKPAPELQAHDMAAVPAPEKSAPRRPPSATPTQVTDPRLSPALIIVTLTGLISTVMLLSNLKDGQLAHGQSYVDRAEQAIAQKDWPAALGAIQKVDENNRQRPGFLRVLADYLIGTRTSPEMLGNTLEKLKPSAMFRAEDHLWLCSAWLASNHIDRTRAAWQDIPASLASGLEATQLKIQLLKKEGQKREAEQIQAALSRLFSKDPTVAEQQAVKDWNSTFPEVRRQARERLWELARRHDAPGLDAIRFLSEQAGHTEVELDQLLRLVTEHPEARTADRLTVVSLLLPIKPDQRAAMIQAEVDRHASGGPAVLAQLSSWLSKEEEQDRILQLIPETRWREQPVLLPLVVQALVDQARWQDLLNTLHEAEQTKQFSKAQLMNWRAQALTKLHPKDAIEPREVLHEAILQGNVEKSEVALMTSAHIAEDWQMPDLALQACQFLALPGTPNEEPMLEKCEQMATLLKDTKAMAEAAVRLSELQPNSTAAARRAAYLRLLRGERVEIASGRTADIAPGDSAAWLVAALKAWRLGDPHSTHDALKHIKDTLGLGPGERAVLAGLLAKTGETARGFQLAEKIRPELLLPEEAAFLNSAK